MSSNDDKDGTDHPANRNSKPDDGSNGFGQRKRRRRGKGRRGNTAANRSEGKKADVSDAGSSKEHKEVPPEVLPPDDSNHRQEQQEHRQISSDMQEDAWAEGGWSPHQPHHDYHQHYQQHGYIAVINSYQAQPRHCRI